MTARSERALSASFVIIAAMNIGAYLATTAARHRYADAASYPFERTPAMLLMAWTFAAVSLLTFGLILLLRKAIANGGRTWAIALGLTSVLMFSLAVAQRPEGAADIYWNTVMSRAWVLHGANPYHVTPNDFPSDPVHPLTIEAWRGSTMVYGPLWMAFSGLPVLISREPAIEFLLMKAMLAIAYVGAGYLLYRLLRRDDPGYANVLLTFWLLNTHAIFEIANAGHNEGLLVAALALTAFGLAKKRPDLALPGLTAAVLIKTWPVALLPFVLCIQGAGKKQWLSGSVASVLLAAASLALFGWPQGMIDALGALHGSNGGMIWQTVADIVFVGVIIALFIAVRKRKTTPAAAAACAVFAFFGLSMSWVYPWYLLAAAPFCAVMTRRGVLIGAILGSIAIVSFAAYAAGIWMLQLLCPMLAVICFFTPVLDNEKERP